MDNSFFKELIERRHQMLTSDYKSAQIASTSIELDQTRVGRLSRMDAMQVQQMEQALIRRRQKEIIELEDALERIQNGDFGLCQQCDEPINPKRLEIDPTAILCIRCAQANESRTG
ncbi:MAG: TraR/DksA family transcriptional regulator [Gammaproteobacteria bacterium]|nr:TraR/DksA family transcriptional regulator [Gammaproteobacteria bacterium]NKB65327.1 TraR/DksA family transcriptional regulator [Gammaproteobacteria bacterium]